MAIALHNLKPAPGAIKSKKRVGRGQGSGKGGTSTAGHKGAQSRSGYKRNLGFEGGQNPLVRQTPKIGRPNHIKKEERTFDLTQLSEFAKKAKVTTITAAFLYQKRAIKKGETYKVLGSGTLTQPLKIEAHAFSQSAQQSIQKANGEAIIL